MRLSGKIKIYSDHIIGNMVKRSIRLFGIFILALCLCNGYGQADPSKQFKVVIDAGHGGHDPGTVGKKVKEKDIALAIALKLGAYIETQMPDVEVIYTRKTDVFVELYRRAQIANQSRADLFISIHCNGVKNTKPMGTETWVMGLHKSDANLEVAQAENAVVLMEDNYTDQYDGFDPNTPESHILFSFFQNAHLDQSLDLASLIQDQFRERANRIDRGVKQAGFLVLYKTTMPGILVEAGFLSNPTEEAYLSSQEGQDHIASSIFRALRDYRDILQKADGRSSRLSNPNPPNDSSSGSTSSISQANSPSPINNIESEIPKGICFAIQIKSSNQRYKSSDPAFRGLNGVREYIQQGAYKYYVGDHKKFEDAVQQQQELRKKGFPDAFIIALRNGERISLDEARSLTGN